MHFLSHELSKCGDDRPDLVTVFRNLSRIFDGAYNMVFLNAMGDMVVLRDPHGFRPLCIAEDGPLFAAASESVPLLNLGFQNVRSLEPGEMIVIQDNKLRTYRFAPKQPTSHCFFEWIYFANVASTLDDRSVYLTRAALGKELARQEQTFGRVTLDRDTIVVPVPDTGKAAADAMAFELGLPSVEGLIRNRYVGRTFIEGQNRAERVQLEVHAVARSPGRQARAAGRGHDRPQHHDEGSPERSARPRRGQGSSRPRCLSADRGTVLLRHRHVHGARVVRPTFHEGQPNYRGRAGSDGHRTRLQTACFTCPSKPSLVASVSTTTSFAGLA